MLVYFLVLIRPPSYSTRILLTRFWNYLMHTLRWFIDVISHCRFWCSANQLDQKPLSTELSSSHDTFPFTADPLTCIGLRADMVFSLLLIKNRFLDRFSFSLDETEFTSDNGASIVLLLFGFPKGMIFNINFSNLHVFSRINEQINTFQMRKIYMN